VERTPATCPGLSQFIRPKPDYIRCLHCNGQIEIWSDEEETKCDNCGATVTRGVQFCLDWCEYAISVEALFRKEEGLRKTLFDEIFESLDCHFF